MKRELRFGLLGLVAALACDDAHKVGEEVGVGGRAAAGGKQASVAGQASLGGAKATGGGASHQSGAGASSLGSSVGSAGATSFGGNAAFGGSPPTGEGGSMVGGTAAGGSAGSGAAGQAGAGGSAGSGAAGQAGAGGSASVDEICTWGTTQFEFTVDDPSVYCHQGYPFVPTVEIYDAAGKYLTYLNARMPAHYGRERCPSCRARLIPALGLGQAPMTESVYRESWAGDIEEIYSCSSKAIEECGVRRCATAGRYVARFCAAPKGNATTCWLDYPDMTDLFPRTACVEVPFDFPSTTGVRGRLSTPAVGTAGASGAGGAAANVGSAGNAGSAGTAACLSGCTFAGIARWCPAEAKHSWRCFGTWDKTIEAECSVASISDAGAYCCPPSFQTQCQ